MVLAGATWKGTMSFWTMLRWNDRNNGGSRSPMTYLSEWQIAIMKGIGDCSVSYSLPSCNVAQIRLLKLLSPFVKPWLRQPLAITRPSHSLRVSAARYHQRFRHVILRRRIALGC